MSQNSIKSSAVFLDRDGTINQEVEYLYRPQDFVWISGAPEAIRLLNQNGFKVIVVTNQAGIARGYYTEEDVERLHDFIKHELSAYSAHIDGFYYSPFHPEGVISKYAKYSDCRKPGTVLFHRAAKDWNVEMEGSFVIGDRETDIEAARRLGIRSILVETGYGSALAKVTKADFVEKDVLAAVKRILTLCTTTR